MQKIATDKNIRETLISKGHQRAQDFTWDSTAEKLWQSIEKSFVK